MSETTIWANLAAPLDPATIKTRPQSTRPNSPPLRYIDSRTVGDRLDSVVAGDWTLALELLPPRVSGNGEEDEACAFKATLTVCGVPRSDVGVGKHYKDAASDAFKRAAVRFGIGRELYDPPKGAVTGEARSQSQPVPVASATPPVPALHDEPACPKCGGKMWDDRAGKSNPKAPDFRCRNKPKTRGGPGCEGVIWPDKPNAKSASAKPGRETDGDPVQHAEGAEEFVARFAEDADSLPF